MKTMLDYINEEQAALIQILNQFQLIQTFQRSRTV